MTVARLAGRQRNGHQGILPVNEVLCGCIVMSAAGQVPRTAPRLVARDAPGCGRGLFAAERLSRGDVLFSCSAFGFVIDIGPGQNQPMLQLCHGCLRFRAEPSVRCAGCSTTYCSDACVRADLAVGHGLCCGALARVDNLGRAKASTREKAMIRFLLRSFAKHKAGRDGSPPGPRPAADSRQLPPPTLEEALGQCVHQMGSFNFEERERQLQHSVRLAKLLGGALVSSRDEALQLLRAAPVNSFALNDSTGAYRGWMMFPHGE